MRNNLSIPQLEGIIRNTNQGTYLNVLKCVMHTTLVVNSIGRTTYIIMPASVNALIVDCRMAADWELLLLAVSK